MVSICWRIELPIRNVGFSAHSMKWFSFPIPAGLPPLLVTTGNLGKVNVLSFRMFERYVIFLRSLESNQSYFLQLIVFHRASVRVRPDVERGAGLLVLVYRKKMACVQLTMSMLINMPNLASICPI